MGMSKDYEEAIKMVRKYVLNIFKSVQTKTTSSFVTVADELNYVFLHLWIFWLRAEHFAQHIHSCRAAPMCGWAAPSLVHAATLLVLVPVLVPLLVLRGVWRIAAGWWEAARPPLRLTHRPIHKILSPKIKMCQKI